MVTTCAIGENCAGSGTGRSDQSSSEAWRCACGSTSADVVDSRPTPYGVRRRRQCAGCGRRFTTAERFDVGVALTELDALRLAEALDGAKRLHAVLDDILRRKRFRGGVLSPGAIAATDDERTDP